MKKITLTPLILLFLGTLSFAQTTIHVPDDQPTIQDGIDAAEDGDTVLVDQGTYFENIDFGGKAIWVASHWLVEHDSAHILNTIIDGSNPQYPDYNSVVNFIDAEDTTSVLCGFTVQNGTGSPTPGGNRAGGGIYADNSGAKIIHNRIINNPVLTNGVEAYGGGMVALASNLSSWLVLRDNCFQENQVITPASPPTLCFGGGAFIVRFNILVERNVFRNNYAEGWPQGGGLAIQECTGLIRHNLCDTNTVNLTANGSYAGQGGGLYVVLPKSGLTVSQNTIINNVCTGISYPAGGGLGVWSDQGSEDLVIERNVISNNTARRGGGVNFRFYYPGCTLMNNIIDYNHATEYGGGIGIRNINSKEQTNNPYMGGKPSSAVHRPLKSGTLPLIINNTIANNTADLYGGGIDNRFTFCDVVIFNNIFHVNMAPNGNDLSTNNATMMTYLYNNNIDTDGIYGDWDGEDNIFEDPQFIDGTYHLDNCLSKCINAGDDEVTVGGNSYTSPLNDIDGDPRPFMNTYPDIGADESPCEIISGYREQHYPANKPSTAPNPFDKETVVTFELASPGHAELSVHDITGKKIVTLMSGHYDAGIHNINMDAAALNSGIYFCTLKTKTGTSTQKVIKLE